MWNSTLAWLHSVAAVDVAAANTLTKYIMLQPPLAAILGKLESWACLTSCLVSLASAAFLSLLWCRLQAQLVNAAHYFDKNNNLGYFFPASFAWQFSLAAAAASSPRLLSLPEGLTRFFDKLMHVTLSFITAIRLAHVLASSVRV